MKHVYETGEFCDRRECFYAPLVFQQQLTWYSVI